MVTHEYSQTVPPVTKFKRIQVTPEQYDEDTQTKYTKTYESQTQTEHLGVDKSSETRYINVKDSFDQTDSCIMVNRHIQTFYKGKTKGTQYKVQRKVDNHPKMVNSTPQKPNPPQNDNNDNHMDNEKPTATATNDSGDDQPYDIYKDPRWDIVLEKLKILDKYDPPKSFVSDIT